MDAVGSRLRRCRFACLCDHCMRRNWRKGIFEYTFVGCRTAANFPVLRFTTGAVAQLDPRLWVGNRVCGGG